MLRATEIEEAIRNLLPEQLRNLGSLLAVELVNATNSERGVITDDYRSVYALALNPLIDALAGKQVNLGTAQLTFGENSQLGDVTIRDFAGGNIVNVTINLLSKEESQASDEHGIQAALRLSHHTILVVDDELAIRAAIGRFLEDAGYRVLVANDGLQGLKIASNHEVDLILADMQMPGLNGYELLLRVRERQIRTRYIVITGTSHSSAMVSACLRLGAANYLLKPFELEEMLSAVKYTIQVDPTLDQIQSDPLLLIDALLSKTADLIIQQKQLTEQNDMLNWANQQLHENIEEVLIDIIRKNSTLSKKYDVTLDPDYYERLASLYRHRREHEKELTLLTRYAKNPKASNPRYFEKRISELRRIARRERQKSKQTNTE
jgi:DNA-binding response OmpR family regulator